jgi:methyl-accepting chemotaxis protein
MQRLLNMKIKTKLISGFLVIAIIAAVIGITGIISMYKLWDADQGMYEENTLALQNAGSAATTFVLVRYNTYKLSVLTDEAALGEVVASNKVLLSDLEGYLQACSEAVVKESLQAKLDTIIAQWDNTYRPGMDRVQAFVLDGDIAAAQEQIPVLAELGTGMYQEFNELFALLSEDSAGTASDNNSVALGGGILIMAALLIGIIASVIIATIIARMISVPLVRAVEVANRLAVGDIDVKLDIENGRQDEIGVLLQAFDRLTVSTKEQVEIARQISEGDLTVNVELRSEKDKLGHGLKQLSEGLREVVSTIFSASSQVSNGAEMLMNSSLELSQGATEQASAVEELTASIEEIAKQTTINAQYAEEASHLADNSKMNAAEGNEQMKSMLTAMEEINDSSKNIGSIVKVIDDIAFQTNILALNAAVEAARAGQYGKGFSVVAEEVKNLAGKSAEAVKETTELVENSIRKIEMGAKIATQTAGFLDRIVKDIEKAAELNLAIAQASSEQAREIEQVNEGINQVSQVVQSNAATSEESAAASEELSAQAEQLKTTVSIFRL